MNRMNKIYKMIVGLSAIIALTACSEEEIWQTPQSLQSDNTATAGVRIVPLTVYVENNPTGARASTDYILTFGKSKGEQGENISVARSLTYYVYSRTANSAEDFHYDTAKSSELNGQSQWVALTERLFDTKTFATVEVAFAKEEGQEYKILVTASGTADETCSSPGITQQQNANPLSYQTGSGTLANLTATLTTIDATNVPQVRNGEGEITYGSNKIYGLREGFYGFCEKSSGVSEGEDMNIITYNEPSALKAFLFRSLARVEFRITNIWYKRTILSNYSFPWMGIFAKTVGTSCSAENYDAFKTALSSETSTATNGWKLLTFYNSQTNPSFASQIFTESSPGTFTFVTYMLPTTTQFSLRIEWNYNNAGKDTYCTEYTLTGGSVNNTPNIGAPIGHTFSPYNNDNDKTTFKIERNRKYIINVNCNSLML